MSESNETKWYKGFTSGLTSLWLTNRFRFKVGGTYEIHAAPVLCRRGFHFCPSIVGVYDYYPANNLTRICLVTPLGKVDGLDDKSWNAKCCTDRIRIDRELAPREIVGLIFKDARGMPRSPGGRLYPSFPADDIRDYARLFVDNPDAIGTWPDALDRLNAVERAKQFLEAFDELGKEGVPA